MAELSRQELQRLARLGAQRRLEELRREEAAIRAAFPDLEGAGETRRGRRRGRTGRSQPAAGGDTAAAQAGAAKAKRRPRRRMTAAQKKAVSDRMKKYWARRKAKG